jgi:uncharacterized membrane protein
MQSLQSHLRNTFLAGIFAAVPIGITIFLLIKVDEWTRIISERIFGVSIPFVGALIAIAAIYLIGVFVTLSLGRYLLGLIDRLLGRIPLLKPLYESWKQISFTPGGGEGMFARVVLIPDETGQMRTLGFTSGQCIAGSAETLCVFVPNAPNPMQGKLYFVDRAKAHFTPLGSEEAFKLLLSTGNYCPADLVQAPAAAP